MIKLWMVCSVFSFSNLKKDIIKINVQYLQCFWLNIPGGENKAFEGVIGIQIMVTMETGGKH